MIRKAFQQIRVISGNNPIEFQDNFNQALKELATKDPKIEFNMGQGHCAYVTYLETVEIPETAEDEFSLVGESFKCRNCPKFIWPTKKDGTINRITKKGECPISTYGFTNRDAAACEYLYKNILNMSIKPILDEDLEDFQLR